ncbi:MAG: hypothetical protein H0T92_13935 [Pyrinomonadaceae bacterium]|nr:hypothetical protein [Pyrinomonadaceae bacterium]
MYRPNFCTGCGAPFERRRWRFWPCRSFCSVCAKEFRRARIILPLLASVALFGGGFLAGRANRSAPPLLIIEQRKADAVTADGNFQSGLQPVSAMPIKADERLSAAQETVYICGARTKRGTPCSRKVRGTGRCWQHRGKAAMLPAAKLIVPS